MKDYITEKEGRYVGNILNDNVSKFEMGDFGLLRGFNDFHNPKTAHDIALQDFSDYLNRYYVLLSSSDGLYIFTQHMRRLNERKK